MGRLTNEFQTTLSSGVSNTEKLKEVCFMCIHFVLCYKDFYATFISVDGKRVDAEKHNDKLNVLRQDLFKCLCRVVSLNLRGKEYVNKTNILNVIIIFHYLLNGTSMIYLDSKEDIVELELRIQDILLDFIRLFFKTNVRKNNAT